MLQGRSRNGIITLPVGGGIVADEVSHELAENVCTDGNNVRFRDGYVMKTEGYAATLTTPVVVPYHIANLQNSGANYWVHVGLTSVYSDNGTTQTNITGTALTGSLTQKIASCVLGGVLIINNQADRPKYWAGSGNLANLTGWTSTHRCKALRSFKNYLIALNVTKGSTNYASMVKWSHAAAPGFIPDSWDESDPTKDAGELDVAETDDEIVDGLALGNTFIIYKQRSCYGMQYLGNNSIFRVFKLPGGFGALTQNCVADTPNGHVVLTNGPDVIRHYANEPQSIIQGRWRRWLAANIDPANYGNSFVVSNRDKSEVWVCIPTTGNTWPNVALVWNWNDDTWTKIAIPNLTHAHFGTYAPANESWAANADTWADDDDPWDSIDVSTRLLASSANTKLYLMDEGDTADGSNFTATFSRVGLSFGDPDTRKLHRGVTLRVDADAGTSLTVEGASSDDIEGPYSYASGVTYTVGTSRKADFMVSGRFVGYRVTSTGAGQWRIKSVGNDIKPQGNF